MKCETRKKGHSQRIRQNQRTKQSNYMERWDKQKTKAERNSEWLEFKVWEWKTRGMVGLMEGTKCKEK